MDALQARALITEWPAFQKMTLGRQHGYSIPEFTRPLALNVGPDTASTLSKYGITLADGWGEGNIILIDEGMAPVGLHIDLRHAAKTLIGLGDGCSLRSSHLLIKGAGHAFCCGRTHPGAHNKILAQFYDRGCGLFLGEKVTSNGVRFHLQGNDTSIMLGDDCMLSWDLQILTSDGHGIFDLETLQVVNSARSVKIGPHVWLGFEVYIQKGVEIGAGSIIGAKSVVHRSIPPNAVAVGVPAAVKRTGCSWTRRECPRLSDIEGVLAQPFMSQGRE